MNIIYIDHYAGSPEMGMEFRPYYMAVEWIRHGHKVSVIAGDYSHLRMKNPSVSGDMQKQRIDGITYYWLKTGTYEGNGIHWAASMFRFVYKLWNYAGKIAEKLQPDVVISSSTYPLDTYAAERICRKSGARHIHEIHDMWPLCLTSLYGMSRWHPFVALMQIAENSFCRHADEVVSLLPGARNYLVRHGMEPHKFHALTNGVVTGEWEHPQALPELHRQAFDRLKQKQKFIILFFGSITRGYALDLLVRAVQECAGSGAVAVFVGDENDYALELKKLARNTCDDQVFFLPKVPKKAVPLLLEEADALYVAAAGEVTKYGISMNKLFDSMMSGRPILYAVDAPNNYIRQFRCGVSVTSGSARALAEGIRQLVQLPRAEREQMGHNGKKAVMRYFTYEKLASRFEKLF